jgi:hypothetical protein
VVDGPSRDDSSGDGKTGSIGASWGNTKSSHPDLAGSFATHAAISWRTILLSFTPVGDALKALATYS